MPAISLCEFMEVFSPYKDRCIFRFSPKEFNLLIALAKLSQNQRFMKKVSKLVKEFPEVDTSVTVLIL